jgi:hypothetical protein
MPLTKKKKKKKNLISHTSWQYVFFKKKIK